MKDAVSQANEALEQMKPAPALLDPTQQGVDFVAPIVTNVQTLAGVWDPLLKRLDAFVTIVDGIAEVEYTPMIAPDPAHIFPRFIPIRRWLGKFYRPRTKYVSLVSVHLERS